MFKSTINLIKIEKREIYFRFLSTDTSKAKLVNNQLFRSEDLKDDQSYTSTSNPRSMMRFYKSKIPHDETDEERIYRLKYEELQIWNHNYWLENNEQFQKVSFESLKFELLF